MSYGLVNGAPINGEGAPINGEGADSSLNHAALGINSTAMGVATAALVTPLPTAIYQAAGIKATTFGRASADGAATALAPSLSNTTFGIARSASAARVDPGLQPVRFGQAFAETINPAHQAQGLEATALGAATGTGIATAGSIQSPQLGAPRGANISTAFGIASTAIGVAKLTVICQVLPMTGTIFGRPTLRRGITC